MSFFDTILVTFFVLIILAFLCFFMKVWFSNIYYLSNLYKLTKTRGLNLFLEMQKKPGFYKGFLDNYEASSEKERILLEKCTGAFKYSKRDIVILFGIAGVLILMFFIGG